MAWQVEDRRTATTATQGQPALSDEIKRELTDKYLPRYPTKRAVLLPALHLVQHQHGWISAGALQEVAEFLGIAPAQALDTATFYEEYWLKPKGKYLLQVCRSLACAICGSNRLTDHLRQRLGIDVGQTTQDGRFTLVELECLGACGGAPALMVNDVLFEDLTVERIDQILDGLPDDPHEFKDPTLS